MGFSLTYQDPGKKKLQRLEVGLLILILPFALYGAYRSQQSWETYQRAEQHLKLGQLHVHNNRFEEGIDEYRQSVALYPELYAAWADLATCYHLLGDHEGEVQVYHQALTHLPDRVELRQGLAEAYHETNDFEAELEQLAAMRTLMPEQGQGILVERLERRAREAKEKRPTVERRPKSVLE